MVESFSKVMDFSTYRSMIEGQCRELDVPLPSENELAVGYTNYCGLWQRIQQAPSASIPVAEFIQRALYDPQSGYYMAGKTILGEAGDFVTAPEISPIFAQSIAQVIRPSLAALNGVLVEFGAGTGALAEALLTSLDNAIRDYVIVEVSPALVKLQQQRLQPFLKQASPRVRWVSDLEAIPSAAVLLANEVLDAIPCHPFRITSNGFEEQVVKLAGNRFVGDWSSSLSQPLKHWLLQHADKYAWQPEQVYEASPWRVQWLESIAEKMEQAVWLLVDYGYTADEFYHQQRHQGSLCCFYQHRRHDQLFYLTGLQDISSHVNFSEMCFAAEACGLQLSGFTTQAQMILQSKVLDELPMSDDLTQRVQLSQALQTLMMPGAMGDLVKVIAFTQGISENAAPSLSSELAPRL
jgi:SAM-dependent MidA family methyltransferase